MIYKSDKNHLQYPGNRYCDVSSSQLNRIAGGFLITSRHLILICLLIILILPVLVFHSVLFANDDLVLSSPRADLAAHFIDWLDFGFRELKNGHLAFWNPYTYSGIPCFETFQSVLIYPPNVLFLMFRLVDAINLSILFHVIAGGLGMFLWGRRNQLHPLAALLMAAMFMLSSLYMGRILAGHLTVINIITWLPFILTAIDANRHRFRPGWAAAGSLFVALLALSGLPQIMMYSLYVSGAYTLLLLPGSKNKRLFIVSFLLLTTTGLLVSGIQLIPGVLSSTETLRSSGLSYELAAFGSLDPGHLTTLITPSFFGDSLHSTYWGHLYWWEMTFFISITGLFLSLYGVSAVSGHLKHVAAGLAVLLFWIALGAYTPLFHLMYWFLPGISSFRTIAKFGIPGCVFLILLAGIAFDDIIRHGMRKTRLILCIIILLAILLQSAAFLISRSAENGDDGWWKSWMQHFSDSFDFMGDRNAVLNNDYAVAAAKNSVESLNWSTMVVIALGILIFLSQYHVCFRYGFFVLAITELLLFSISSVTTFSSRSPLQGPILDTLLNLPDEQRILNLVHPNCAMRHGVRDIWGYDPLALKRYCELMAYTQGLDPDHASQSISFTRPNRIFQLLRCRYIIRLENGRILLQEAANTPMKRFSLIQEWQVVSDRDEIFRRLDNDSFDFSKTVLLNTAPVMSPDSLQALQPGIVVTDQSVNHTLLSVTTPNPCVLLITDAWHPGWSVTGTCNGLYKTYTVLPADYALMGIPLSAGIHELALRYIPRGFTAGIIASGFGVMVLCGLIVWSGSARKKVEPFQK